MCRESDTVLCKKAFIYFYFYWVTIMKDASFCQMSSQCLYRWSYYFLLYSLMIISLFILGIDLPSHVKLFFNVSAYTICQYLLVVFTIYIHSKNWSLFFKWKFSDLCIWRFLSFYALKGFKNHCNSWIWLLTCPVLDCVYKFISFMQINLLKITIFWEDTCISYKLI